MGNLAGFDATQVDTENRFDPVPAGQYLVVVTNSQMKPTQSGGEYLGLDLEIQEPEQFRGRKLWDNLNLVNANSTAVEIAQRQLGQLCLAAGIATPEDSSDLHFKPVVAIVAIDKKDKTRNEIKGYKPVSEAGNAGGQVAPFQRPAPATTAPAGNGGQAPAAAAPAPAQEQKAAAGGRPLPPWMTR